MNKNLLSIKEAAKELKVSSQTLRRWETSGKLIPQRTQGNQRRYTLEQITNYKLQTTNKQKIINNNQGNQFGFGPEDVNDGFNFRTYDFESNFQPLTSNIQHQLSTDDPQIIQGLDSFSYLRLEMSKFSKGKKATLGSFLFIFFLLLFTLTTKIVVDALNTSTAPQLQNANPQAVLGASTQAQDYVFKVNVPSSFASSADFLNGITIQGKSVFIGGIDTQNGNINAGTGNSHK